MAYKIVLSYFYKCNGKVIQYKFSKNPRIKIFILIKNEFVILNVILKSEKKTIGLFAVVYGISQSLIIIVAYDLDNTVPELKIPEISAISTWKHL